MSEAVHFARVREHLEVLEREVALGELGPLLEAAAGEERSPTWLLDQLLIPERAHRFERRVAANLELGGIPSKKPLEDFDLEAQSSVPKAIVEELATLRFLRQGQNVLILGPTRIGKTHLAIGVTLVAIEDGHRAYFRTFHALINKARVAREKYRLHTLHATLVRADLFVLDAVGSQPLERDDATGLPTPSPQEDTMT